MTPNGLNLEQAAIDFIEQTKSTFGHDRSLTVGASEIGQCARRIAYLKAGTKEDDDFWQSWGAAKRGDILEDNWTAPMTKAAVKSIGGELLWSGQENQRSLVVEDWKLSCTPDGLAVNVPENALERYHVEKLTGGPERKCFIVEMKSFDPRKNTNDFPQPQHMAQLQTQLGMINHDKSIPWAPKWGIVVYVNASWVDDIRVFADFYRKHEFYNLVRRALSIYSIPPHQHLPEGAIAGEKECGHCPFKNRCNSVETARPTRTTNKTPFTKPEQIKINSAVGTIENTQRNIKREKLRQDDAKAKLKQYMKKHETHNIQMKLADGRPYTARWLKTAGRTTFDFPKMAEQLMEDGYDLEDFKTTSPPGERITVNVDDGKGKDIASNMTPSTVVEKRKKRKAHIKVEVNEH